MYQNDVTTPVVENRRRDQANDSIKDENISLSSIDVAS